MSPVMVGAMTVLVAAMAMFLAYNAGSGLPFVPTYDVTVEVPDTQELVPNNEVLIGGRRVGVIASSEAALTPEGRPYARLTLKLEQPLDGELLDDATARVRARSLLGAKYLELTPGSAGDPIPPGGTLPLDRARVNVEVDEVIDELDAPTRRNLGIVVDGFGTGFAGRGGAINAAIEDFAPLIRDAAPILHDLADPATGLARFNAAYTATVAELAAAPGAVGGVVRNGAATFAALDAAGTEFERLLEDLPPTIAEGTSSLAVLRPVLARGRDLATRLRPAAALLPETVDRLAGAAESGTPALRRTDELGPLLDDAFVSLERLATSDTATPAFDSLAGVLPELRPAVEYLAPYQTVCNYIAIAARNLASTPAEGNASGNWLRFSAIIQPSEMFPAGSPASELHFNPYPNGAAPGQPRECEAGREPYLPGQRIGNVPGNQGLATELTTPEQTLAVSD